MNLRWTCPVRNLALALALYCSGVCGWASAADAPATSTTPPATATPLAAPRAARSAVWASGLHCQDMAFGTVIDSLRNASGANIVVRWKVLEALGVTRETPITLDVERVTFRKALRLVLDQASPATLLTWTVADNVLTITTRDDADKEMITRVYVVSDLVTPPMVLPPAPSFSLANSSTNSGSGTAGGGQSPFGQDTTASTPVVTAEQMGADLVDMITTVIRPDIWNKNGGQAAIRYFSGKLIITAPLSVHEAIGGPFLAEGTK